MALVLSDGQLTTSSATLVTATGSQYIALTFFNTSESATATVRLTLARRGGTARNFAIGELGPLEAMYVRGIGLDPSDTLAGYADLNSLVDYLAFWDRDDSDFLIFTRAADGSPKSSTTSSTSESEEDAGPDQGQVENLKVLNEIRDLLMKIA